MHCEKTFSLSKLIFSVTIVSVLIPSLAQQGHAQGSWLDRPLVNWNRTSGRSPQLRQPPAASGDSANSRRCRRQVRQPANAAERALVRRGWMMYGQAYSYGSTRIVTALSGFDGMCRPTGFQAFAYREGRYTGTLSPVPMDSRTDGSLSDVHVNNGTNISADFARYSESDPLCCPSRTSSVVYNFLANDPPMLIPRNVMHRPIRETNEPVPSGANDEAALLYGKVWTLTQLEERRLSTGRPYVEFDRDQKRVSGSGGCNRFFGKFEVDGSMLKLSGIASTKRACLDADLQRIENDFLKLLDQTTRFEGRGNMLRLYANDRLILAFASK